MSARKAKAKLLITQRALSDINEIEAYSVVEWGRSTATKYLADIEAALLRVQQSPGLLRPEEDLHPALQFYRVNKHLLVCDVQSQAIFLLTVIHASRDIPCRLAEMAPTLAVEVELLQAKLRRPKR